MSLLHAYVSGISNVKSREDLVMSGSDSSTDPFQNAPFKKHGESALGLIHPTSSLMPQGISLILTL